MDITYDQLLRAFIEASGYEVEVLIDRKETPISKQMGESCISSGFNHGKPNDLVISSDGSYKRGKDECYYLKPSLNVDYEVTKKVVVNLTDEATKLHDDFHYMHQIKKLVVESGIPKSVILDLIGGIYD